ncbi:peptide/nickel transport system permease protein [Terribacillus saccharophilus]|uniref:Peptide/nickel transport system permease protein n=1 Tax=Terribacillus saccharophilus TaxID=361277 RepID=A0AAX2EFT4_9BACI|nr:peptide/nickel transport system permease protein [Terribacillus saccharophilus]
MRIVSFFSYLVLGLVAILLVSCIPSVFSAGFFGYWHNVFHLVEQVMDPSQWVYTTPFNRTYSITSFFGDAISYSMTILILALVTGFGGGLLFAVLSFLLPKRVVEPLKRLGNIAESIPDVLIAFGIQLLVVFLYKQFGFLLLQFSSVGSDEIYILPILIIAILPFFSFYRIVLSMLEEEQQKDYVVLAKSKGLSKSYILFVHMLRNILPTAFLHTKVITWATMSTIPAIEYIMNLYGITSILKDLLLRDGSNAIEIFFILVFFFIPFYIIYGVADRVLVRERTVKQEPPVWRKVPLVGKRKKGSVLSFKRNIKHSPVYRNWKFVTGSALILLLFLASCLYTVWADPSIQVTEYQYEDGRAVDKAPFPPNDDYWLGTDRSGRHLDDVLITGAKFTIGFAILLAALRIGGGFLLAIPYVLLVPMKVRKILDKFTDTLHYIPQSLLALFLLTPIIGASVYYDLTITEKIFWQILILLLLVLPLTTSLLSKEIDHALSTAFVTSGTILGGSKLHLIRKHVWPQIRMRCFILFGQQTAQVLVLFIHLGIFGVYFGGTVVKGDLVYPATAEWSSQIPFLRYMLMQPDGYYSAVVIAAFLFLIFCVQLIVAGLKEVEHSRLGIKGTKDRRVQTAVSDKQAAAGLTASPDAFRFHDKTIELK